MAFTPKMLPVLRWALPAARALERNRVPSIPLIGKEAINSGINGDR